MCTGAALPTSIVCSPTDTDDDDDEEEEGGSSSYTKYVAAVDDDMEWIVGSTCAVLSTAGRAGIDPVIGAGALQSSTSYSPADATALIGRATLKDFKVKLVFSIRIERGVRAD